MAQGLTDKTKGILSAYLVQVRNLPNETAKRERFAALLGELFQGSSKLMTYAAGAETSIRVDAGRKKGFIDTYYGNAVIEFEASLKATGKHAEEQLRGYVAGVWAKEGTDRPLIAIASDGIAWRTYRPTLAAKSKSKAENVSLELIRDFTLTDATLGEFWLWLTSLLFRPSQIRPTAEQFRQDFGAKSPAFRYSLDALTEAWIAVRGSKEPGLAFKTWQRYLAVTYGSLPAAPSGGEGEVSDLELLFLKHTYLASVARLLIWASFSRGKTTEDLRTVASKVLSGRFFEALKLANVVEDDFFQWVRRTKAESILAALWERILVQMLTYDLAHLGEDVLKGVYQELVDPADRHDLGEYYTPDWLCERIVSELLPAKGLVSVLDPACGSGSFLRAVIAHLRSTNPSESEADMLAAILDHVVGIDIHPLAATISRATYVLALGPLVRTAKRAIYIPVYLADSLFLPTEVRQADILKGGGFGYEVSFGGKKIILPNSLVESPDLFDRSIAGCAKVAVDHAVSKKETPQSLRAYLSKAVEGFAEHSERDNLLHALWQFTTELADLVRSKENSIWAFIVRNGYRPAMLRGRFDFIVGNPPWLSYRYIQAPDYQEEVKTRAVVEYRIAPPSQRLLTQMELATIFLAHSMAVFARNGASLGFVMPLSIFAADQHVQLRTRSYTAPFRLNTYWDLRDVEPLFNVPSCVLFARREASRGSMKDVLAVKQWSGHLETRDLPWSAAKERLVFKEAQGYTIFLGDRTAFSTIPGRTEPNDPSPYSTLFRDGATIFPRNFYFVKVDDLHGGAEPDRLYSAETDLEQAEDAKPPYKDIRISGDIEGRFFFHTALARHVLPFATRPLPVVALPVERNGDDELVVRTADQLRKGGDREFARWMAKAGRLWGKYRGDKADRMTVYERLDYQKGLTAQKLSARHLVVYNVDGTNISAAYIDRASLPLPFVVDYRLYWLACSEREECDYLTAILNSEVVNQAIKPFQTVGLLGERHVSKKALDLPFPRYDASRSADRTLSTLGAEARAKAMAFVEAGTLPKGLGRQRAAVRTHLASLLADIDTAVKEII